MDVVQNFNAYNCVEIKVVCSDNDNAASCVVRHYSKSIVYHGLTFFADISFSPACPENNGPGEADIRAFDFISLYGLDNRQRMPKGVTITDGSNRLQTAYRLDSMTPVLSPTR